MSTPSIHLLATKAALEGLFRQRTFSICAINDLLAMNAIIPDPEVIRVMRTLHCLEYAGMDPQLRQWLMDSTIRMFQGLPVDLSGIDSLREQGIADGIWTEVPVVRKGLFGFLGH